MADLSAVFVLWSGLDLGLSPKFAAGGRCFYGGSEYYLGSIQF